MITFKEYLEEHCKTGEYFKAFNMLQVKILRSLYTNFLAPNDPKFREMRVENDNDLIMMYFQELNIALKLLGDVLCRFIPDEKTVKYSQNDVDRWAGELYKLIMKNQ